MKEINSSEIAKLAGVSRSTVSRVVNNYSNVPPSTREKVLDVIKKYNYYPNLSAQALVGKKTGTIVLFMVESGRVSNDSTSNFIITSAIESASDYGYHVLTSIIRDPKNSESKMKMKEVFYQGRVDGGIVIGTDNEEPVIEELISEGFIIGILDQEIREANEPNRISYSFDNKNGAMKAVEYLASLNHQKIGIINGNMNRLAGIQKYEGYIEGMKECGLTINPEWLLPGDFSKESGYEAISNLLEQKKELPSAIFAVNDSVAFGAIKALREHSIKVPEDISIIGMDDHLLSAYSNPPLTTMRADFKNTMENLTSHVIKVIRNEEVREPAKSEMRLIVRESCKKLHTDNQSMLQKVKD